MSLLRKLIFWYLVGTFASYYPPTRNWGSCHPSCFSCLHLQQSCIWMPLYELKPSARLPQTTAVQVRFLSSCFFVGERTDRGKRGTFLRPYLGRTPPIYLFTYRFSFVFSFRGLLCSGGHQVTKQNRPLQFGTRLLGPLCRLYGQVNHVTIHTVHLRRRSQLLN